MAFLALSPRERNGPHRDYSMPRLLGGFATKAVLARHRIFHLYKNIFVGDTNSNDLLLGIIEK